MLIINDGDFVGYMFKKKKGKKNDWEKLWFRLPIHSNELLYYKNQTVILYKN